MEQLAGYGTFIAYIALTAFLFVGFKFIKPLLAMTGEAGLTQTSKIGRYTISIASLYLTFYSVSNSTSEILISFNIYQLAIFIISSAVGVFIAFLIEGYILFSERALVESFINRDGLTDIKLIGYVAIYIVFAIINYNTMIWTASIVADKLISNSQTEINKEKKQSNNLQSILEKQLTANIESQKLLKAGDYRAFIDSASMTKILKERAKQERVLSNRKYTNLAKNGNSWAKKQIQTAQSNLEILKNKEANIIAEAKQLAFTNAFDRKRELKSENMEIMAKIDKIKTATKETVKGLKSDIKDNADKKESYIRGLVRFLMFAQFFMGGLIAMGSDNTRRVNLGKTKVQRAKNSAKEEQNKWLNLGSMFSNPHNIELEEDTELHYQPDEVGEQREEIETTDKEDALYNVAYAMLFEVGKAEEILKNEEVTKSVKHSKTPYENFMKKVQTGLGSDAPLSNSFTVRDIQAGLKVMYPSLGVSMGKVSDFLKDAEQNDRFKMLLKGAA